MSYHHFPNLRVMFAGDLSKKFTKGVESMDFKVRDCNYKDPLGTRKYQYGGVCRVPIIIYKITCKMTNKICIGNTQQKFKKRMAGHFQEVNKLMEKGVHCKTFRRHLAKRSHSTITRDATRDLIKYNILLQGNPISVVKTFRKSTCTLCNREQMEIIKLSSSIPDQLINSCSEIHGACRHKPRFQAQTHSEEESIQLIQMRMNP
jgi:hypothetical protein